MIGVNRFVTMAVPNNELLYIYENTIEKWFQDEIKQKNLKPLYAAMLSADVSRQLQSTISYMDNKEAFYHGFMLGLLANLDYLKKSNREAGTGRYDICVYQYDLSIPPVILELKQTDRYRKLDEVCHAALRQITEKRYDFDLAAEGYTEVICYGVAFFKKQVRVCVERRQISENL